MADGRSRRRGGTRTRRRQLTEQQQWPTRFHVCIAGTTITPTATAKAEFRAAVNKLWASPMRKFFLDPADKNSISMVVQGNANTTATAADVVSTQPGDAGTTLRNKLKAFYDDPALPYRPEWAFLNYEPGVSYQVIGQPNPLLSGFQTADIANGEAAMGYLAQEQKVVLADFANKTPSGAFRYGAYWLEISNKPLLQVNRDRLIENAEAGVFAEFDHLFLSLYPEYDDTVDSLVAHYQSYYDAAVAASAAAVAQGEPSFEAVPAFRVRDMSESPETSTISDTQAEAMGKLLAINRVPNCILYFIDGADDDKLDGLSVMYDAYVENL